MKAPDSTVVKTALLCMCLLLLMLNGHGTAQQPEYSVINLGKVGAVAINDSSEIAMTMNDVQGQDDTHAYIWKNGSITLLPSTTYAKALGINNNSYVVGYEGAYNPVMWDSNGNKIPLGIPAGFQYGQPKKINDSNIAVGIFFVPVYDSLRAFYYTGVINILPDFPNTDSSRSAYQLFDINNNGKMIGSSAIYDNSGAYSYNAFVWSGGGITYLGNNQLNAINNFDQIAGNTQSGPQHAVKWTDYVPYVYDDPIITSSIAVAINDSSIMVGYGTGVALKFVDDNIIDLNSLIDQNAGIVLTHAFDINNKGEIIARGYFAPNTADWANFLLRPHGSDILYPSLNDLLVAGETDTIRWANGTSGRMIDLKYSVDDGVSYRPINNAEIADEEGKYGWAVPDSLIYRHVTIKMTEHTTGDSLAVSEVFRIKPYIITRVGDDGEYVVYEFDKHRWGFGNNDYEIWPSTWWTRFDYQNGTDPFTGMPYTFYPIYLPFATAQRSDFPDWESFVRAFTVDACYEDPILGYYSLIALNRWAAIKHAWGGACYGMAYSNALAFDDQGAFRTKYTGYPNYVNPIDVVAGPSVIPVISEMFTYQFGNPFKAHDIERRANSYPTETVEQLKQLFSQDDVAVAGLALYNNNGPGGHEVLPYKLERDTVDREFYYIFLWDNSYTSYENALISVDTSFNGNRGFWDAAYGFISTENWGGEKYLFVEPPASEFLSHPTLAKPASPHEVFAVPSGRMEITTSVTASTLITDTEGNSIGSDTLGDIPDAYPLTIKNGSETPPYGYQLPAGNYTVTLSDMKEDTAQLFFFMEDGTFSYKRSDVEPGQTDRVSFIEGFSVINPDAESKAVNLAYTSNGPDGETLFAIQSLILSPDDSIHVETDTDDRLILKSFGDATSYNVVVGSVSEEGIEVFEHVSVPLPSNTSHILVPDWTDDAGDQLKILIDTGNDGSVDDSLQVENQTVVEEQTSQAAPSGFRLNGNYPNPFNPTTTIGYSLQTSSQVTISVYMITGQQIGTFELGMQSAGGHEYLFDGSGLTSGVYLYRIDNGSVVRTGRMLLMK